VFFAQPAERWVKTGAFTGACWYQCALHFTSTKTVSRLNSDGSINATVSGLPGRGGHKVNDPVVGPADQLYRCLGSTTNAGMVGAENFACDWLPRFAEQA